jgi:hypothetical protein
MAITRYVRFAIPAVAAGARTNPTFVPTFDDQVKRRLVGFLTTNQTKLIHTQVDVAGRVFLDIDHGLAAQQKDWVPVLQEYPAGLAFSVNVINDSAGALAVNTDAINLKYEVDQALVATPGVPS